MNTRSHLSPERIRQALQSRFNLVRGLTVESLNRQLDAYHQGYLRDMAATWELIENRDIFIKSVAAKRKKSAARNAWEIHTLDQSPEALRQKAALEYFYNNLSATHALDTAERGGLPLLARQMMDAVGKGHAVHEILWQPRAGGQLTAEFRCVPLWFFENTTGTLRFLEAEFAMFGSPLDEGGWLLSRGDGLMEACSVAYVIKKLPLESWLHYCELFGIPAVIGHTPAAKATADWKYMEELVRSVATGGSGLLATTEAIELLETRGAAHLPFPPLIEYMDRAIAALWRGSDLSTISRVNAVGASLQTEETELLVEDDAAWLSETLNLQIDRRVIQHLFGDVPHRAYFKFLAPQRQNLDQDLRVDEFLVRHGAPLAVEDALERYGRSTPATSEHLLKQETAAANP